MEANENVFTLEKMPMWSDQQYQLWRIEKTFDMMTDSFMTLDNDISQKRYPIQAFVLYTLVNKYLKEGARKEILGEIKQLSKYTHNLHEGNIDWDVYYLYAQGMFTELSDMKSNTGLGLRGKDAASWEEKAVVAANLDEELERQAKEDMTQ